VMGLDGARPLFGVSKFATGLDVVGVVGVTAPADFSGSDTIQETLGCIVVRKSPETIGDSRPGVVAHSQSGSANANSAAHRTCSQAILFAVDAANAFTANSVSNDVLLA
jgi:hypothetical protein